MGSSIRVFIKRKDFENLKERSDVYVEDVLEELFFIYKYLQGASFYYYEEFFSEEGYILNKNNLKRFLMFLIKKELETFEEEDLEELFSRLNSRDPYVIFWDVLKERLQRKLIEVFRVYDLLLTYYIYKESEKVDKNEFMPIEEAIVEIIKNYPVESS